MSIDTLRTVLSALVNSRLQYGIIVRGTSHKYLLQEINSRLVVVGFFIFNHKTTPSSTQKTAWLKIRKQRQNVIR